jgi:peptide/nickel transport system substrate-binding protein
MHYRSDKLEAEPELAESWQFSADYQSLTLKLRRGVQFHTGRPFTSADVKWNLERVADPKTGASSMNMARLVQAIEMPDESTAVLHFGQPCPSALDLFESIYIADSETLQEMEDGKRFVGTGPFTFKEWVPGDHFTLVRNPDYWQKGLPYLAEITARVLPDAQAQLLNLQTGAADVATSLEPRDIKDLQNDEAYSLVINAVTAAAWYVGVNVQMPPFGEKRVRQAVAYLLDRKRIVDTQLFFGQPTVLPWDKTSPAYTPELADKYQYNPTKAKDLLASAGVAEGTPASITIVAGQPSSLAIAELLQEELSKVGFKSTVEKLGTAEYVQKLNSAQFGGLWISSVGSIHMSPSTLFLTSFTYRVPNSSNFDTPEYRKLIDDVLRTTDATELKNIYRQINELWLEECFVIPIASVERPTVTTAKVKGLTINRSGRPVVLSAWKTT